MYVCMCVYVLHSVWAKSLLYMYVYVYTYRGIVQIFTYINTYIYVHTAQIANLMCAWSRNRFLHSACAVSSLTCIHQDLCIPTCMYVCMHVCILACMHLLRPLHRLLRPLHTYMYVCMHAYALASTHSPRSWHVYMCVCVCVYVCVWQQAYGVWHFDGPCIPHTYIHVYIQIWENNQRILCMIGQFFWTYTHMCTHTYMHTDLRE